MKKYMMFLPMVLLLLLPASSLAGQRSDRSVSLSVLKAHAAAEKRFAAAPLQPAFRSEWRSKTICLNEMIEGVRDSTMSDDDKFGFVLSFALIASFDYMADASSEAREMVRREAARMQRVSNRLRKTAESKEGKIVARSLQGHKQAALAFLGLQGSVDYCAVKGAIESAGGYSAENINTALSNGFAGTWLDSETVLNALSKKIERAGALIERGQKVMNKVRPRIKSQRVSRYGEVVTLRIGVNSLRSLDLAELDERSLQRVRSFSAR